MGRNVFIFSFILSVMWCLTGDSLSVAGALTLQEAEKLALENYPLINSLECKSQSSKLKAKSIKLKRFGLVNLNTGISKFNRTYMLVPMSHPMTPQNPPAFDSKTFFYGVSWNIPLYLGGNIAREVKIENLRSALFKNLEEATKWQVKYNVDAVYLEYLSLSETEKALKAYEKSLLKLCNDVETGIKVGKFAKVDLLKVKYSLEDVRSKIKEIKAKKEALVTALEVLTGVKIDAVEPLKVAYAEKHYSFESLYRKLLKNNHLLKAKRKELKMSGEKVSVEKGKYKVRINLTTLYTRNYGFDSGENEGYGKALLNFQFPVFTFGRKDYDILSAGLEKLSRQKELEVTERDLRKELANAVASLNAIQSRIRALSKKLDLAEEVERIETLKYKSGKGDMDHLLIAKAKRFLTRAELAAFRYRWEAAVRRINALVEAEK